MAIKTVGIPKSVNAVKQNPADKADVLFTLSDDGDSAVIELTGLNRKGHVSSTGNSATFLAEQVKLPADAQGRVRYIKFNGWYSLKAGR